MASFASTGKKIVAIGRNYAKHARELGNAIPEKPFFFLKPTTSYVHSPGKVEIPRGTIVHHESRDTLISGPTPALSQMQLSLEWSLDIQVVTSKQPTQNPIFQDMVGLCLLVVFTTHSAPAVLAIDMTARNMQDAAKKKGLPWSAAKGFDTFTPIRYSRTYTVMWLAYPS